MDKAYDLLKKHWGFDSFRKPQAAIIKAVLGGNDAFVLLPTGAGKSICYQIPALMTEGVCLVVSPLIALMEDQVKSLEEKGIKALVLSSKLNRHDTIIAFDNLMHGNYKFLYLSPEKLQSEFIQEKISQLSLNLIAIDEAHCISQWGHDFRSAYLKIPVLNDIHPGIPKIALTATATARVKNDIIENLQLTSAKIFTGSYYRDNLYIRILKKEDIRSGMLNLLKSIDEPAIVYVGTRKNTVQYARFLKSQQIKATHYHGGLDNKQKSEALQQWKEEKSKVMVATNAFGMGIDKSNVRMVIHANLPNSVENYMQEIGRAGRDGKPSMTYLLYNDNSILESELILKKSIVSPELCRSVYGKLNDYYQIANGELSEEIFNFDLQEFALHYDFQFMQVYYALNHLQNEDVIFYDQNPNKTSRIKIIENSTKLFQVQSSQNIQAKVLQMLLRTYGGVHEQFIAINESLISSKLNQTKDEVIQALRRLDLDKVLVYNESSNRLKLKFLVPREDNFVYHMFRANITQRNKTKEAKSKGLYHLIKNDQICRQIQLLHYFGEILDTPCGHCDVCLSKKPTAKIDHQELSGQILNLIKKNKTITTNEVNQLLPIDKGEIVKTLQLMVERKLIGLNLQNKFYIIT